MTFQTSFAAQKGRWGVDACSKECASAAVDKPGGYIAEQIYPPIDQELDKVGQESWTPTVGTDWRTKSATTCLLFLIQIAAG